VFPAAASRAVEKCTSLLLASWMTGWREPGREARQKKRDKRSGREQKRKGGKKEKAEKEEEIVHLSSCKVGKMDGTRNFPSRGSALGHNLQFLTIRLDQPPYKRMYYVATLRRDSHGRSDAR